MSTSTLSTALLDPGTRPRVVDALLVLADAEISTKKGISGTMLKTAFAGAAALAERLDASGDIELAASDTAAHYVLMTDPDFAIAQLRDFTAR